MWGGGMSRQAAFGASSQVDGRTAGSLAPRKRVPGRPCGGSPPGPRSVLRRSRHMAAFPQVSPAAGGLSLPARLQRCLLCLGGAASRVRHVRGLPPGLLGLQAVCAGGHWHPCRSSTSSSTSGRTSLCPSCTARDAEDGRRPTSTPARRLLGSPCEGP
eukprot:jgi/Botrbrau1/2568/Bobra.0079s0052.2